MIGYVIQGGSGLSRATTAMIGEDVAQARQPAQQAGDHWDHTAGGLGAPGARIAGPTEGAQNWLTQAGLVTAG